MNLADISNAVQMTTLMQLDTAQEIKEFMGPILLGTVLGMVKNPSALIPDDGPFWDEVGTPTQLYADRVNQWEKIVYNLTIAQTLSQHMDRVLHGHLTLEPVFQDIEGEPIELRQVYGLSQMVTDTISRVAYASDEHVLKAREFFCNLYLEVGRSVIYKDTN